MSEEYELSEREIEIIRLVATGASNKEIAQALVISPNTVKVHLRNIFSKLNVVSRTEATMTAIRMGWVESPSTTNKIDQVITATNVVGEENLSAGNQNPVNLTKSIWFWGFIIVFLILGAIAFRAVVNQNSPTPTLSVNEAIQSVTTERWSKLTDLPQAQKGMGAVRYEKRFFLIGGEDSEGILNKVSIFDVENDAWSQGANIPIAISEVNAALIGEKIYVPGGRTIDNLFSKKLFIYNPREDNWETKADLPVAISGYAMTSYEGKLYLFGGWDGSEYLKEIWIYDPGINEWQSFGQLPEERGFASAEVVGGVIHLMGGINNKRVLSNHDLFYPQRQLENEIAWEVASDLPQPRYGMESSVLADMIYVAGGMNENSNELPLIQYLPPKDTWMELDQPPLSVGALPSVLPYETKLYVMGGETADGVQTTLQSYQAVYTVLVPVIRQ